MTTRTLLGSWDDREPTTAELDAIADEWPLIAAELAVFDAETAVAAGDGGDLAARRLAAARQELADITASFEPAGPGTFRPIPPARLIRRPTLSTRRASDARRSA